MQAPWDAKTRLSELKVDPSNPDKVLAGSERKIMEILQPYANHNGGEVSVNNHNSWKGCVRGSMLTNIIMVG